MKISGSGGGHHGVQGLGGAGSPSPAQEAAYQKALSCYKKGDMQGAIKNLNEACGPQGCQGACLDWIGAARRGQQVGPPPCPWMG